MSGDPVGYHHVNAQGQHVMGKRRMWKRRRRRRSGLLRLANPRMSGSNYDGPAAAAGRKRANRDIERRGTNEHTEEREEGKKELKRWQQKGRRRVEVGAKRAF